MRSTWSAVVALPALALLFGPVPARGQDTAKAQATPPAIDSATLYQGDWEFVAQTRDSTITGLWHINYANGQFTGVVTRLSAVAAGGGENRSGGPPSPIRSMTLRTNKREFTLMVDFNAETYTFSGRLENARNINGSLSTRGGIGRLRAQKRS